MVNSPADDVDTMVDDQSIMLPEQGQEMKHHIPLKQSAVPSPWPETQAPHP